MKKIMTTLTALIMVFVLASCAGTTNVTYNIENHSDGSVTEGTNDPNAANNPNGKSKKELEEQERRDAEEKARRDAEEKARKEAEEQAKKEAQKVAEGLMDRFLVLDLKGMASYTDANIDYTQMSYLSLDEYKREMLNKFAVFQAMGLPLDGFTGIIDKVFASYEKYSSYTITNVEMRGDDVVFDINAEYIRAETMENIINNAINRINLDDLEKQAAAVLLVKGLSGKSVTDMLKSVLEPVVNTLDLAVTRSIEELTPERGKVTLVASKIDGKWVIRDELSDYSGISRVFERTNTAQ